MKLYHGSKYRHIVKFNLEKARNDTDFGRGLYFTPLIDQAIEFSCKNSKKSGAVYEIDIDLDSLPAILRPEASNNDIIYMIYLCRLEISDVVNDTVPGFDDADVVYGEVLDGRIKDFKKIAERFNEGIVDEKAFIKLIKMYDINDKIQFCFKSDLAIQKANESLVKKYLTENFKIIEEIRI